MATPVDIGNEGSCWGIKMESQRSYKGEVFLWTTQHGKTNDQKKFGSAAPYELCDLSILQLIFRIMLECSMISFP